MSDSSKLHQNQTHQTASRKRPSVVVRPLTLLLVLVVTGSVMTAGVTAQEPEQVSSADRHAVVFDPSLSSVKFTLGAFLHKVHGTAKLQAGRIEWNPLESSCQGDIVIDATSMESGNPRRDRDMHNKVLESDSFPDIIFSCESLEGEFGADGLPSGALTAVGRFRIHGDQHALSVELSTTSDAGQIVLEGSFEVPYVEWGMKDPSKPLLRVAKVVEIELRLVGQVE